MVKKHYVALGAVFFIVLGLRLFFAFQNSHFSDDQAYFALRQAEHITKTGVPLYYDKLSYGGRVHVFLPLYYYFLGFFGFFVPLNLVLKIVPNIFASCLIFVVYGISYHLTRNRKLSVLAAAISACIPVYMSQTTNSVSPYTLVVPLMFLLLYLFMKIKEDRKFVTYYILFFFLLTFTHASVSVFVLGLLLYLILAKVGGVRTSRAELEVTLFSTFLVLWSYFVIFKRLFLSYGTSVIWQNIPSELLFQYFREITILGVINQIGLIPFFTGIYILYKYVLRVKSKPIYLLTGFTLAVSLLLWLKMISFNRGLMILGTILVILFGQFSKISLQYIEKTKLLRFKPYFIGAAICLLAATSLAPAIFYTDREIRRGFSDDEIKALTWLGNNTNQTEVVLGTLRDGNLIAAIAQRPSVMDSNFLLIPNINQRLLDLKTIFSTSSEIEAVRLLTQYDVSYIYFSKDAKLKYKRTSLPYTEDTNCFQLVYDKGVEIYRTRCKLETIT